ncbi:hypothetical protein PbJCM13498_32380 [Prolixibacter bellariivorans]|uniref:DUF4249 domain-containing protein n=1 Tax=Prolixibacter bellariivorans TaxID=314319 RepID=A0A5M4B2J0_9BACT|nr:DUF4249 domain-containing protein [Prolixibacter bellariivorans]GET34375.1 hypothetical protein PbJCM13498_32380 [Prolixibacter bellariivorans]
MSVKKRYLIIVAIVLVAFGIQRCVEPFNPPITNYRDLLVISGTLTDEPGTQTITVSKTSSYTDSAYIPENGCSVTVLDDKGNIVAYSEEGEGKYTAEFTSDELQHGTAYKLRVIDNDGDVYESDYQTLNPAPAIDSLTASYQPLVTAENPEGLKGYQFYVNTSDHSGKTQYYRWSMEETWEYHSPYTVFAMWDGALHLNYFFPDNRTICWMTKEVPGIYTGTTRDMAEDVLRNIKLNYVSTQTDRLMWRYSLLVREYALSAEAYEFWNGLEKQTQQTGGLYESQPYMITGNITCVSQPNKQVLGFFSASGVSKKRIFVGPAPDPVKQIVCSSDTIKSVTEDLMPYPPSSYPVYMYKFILPSGAFMKVASDQQCFDCLKRGGTNVRPSYWQ